MSKTCMVFSCTSKEVGYMVMFTDVTITGQQEYAVEDIPKGVNPSVQKASLTFLGSAAKEE